MTSQLDYRSAKDPNAATQRGPMDKVWFTVLFASIAVGIGMTIFAPVGDAPPAPVQTPRPAPSSAPALEPTTAEATPAIVPTTTPATSPAP